VIPILRIGPTLFASVQVDLHEQAAERFQTDVVGAIEKTRARGLVVDITSIEMVDTYVARVLVETGRMASLMGVKTVLVGMRPQVAATLVRMGFPTDGIHTTALDLDDGLAALGYALVPVAAKK
jgi:rsbT antagonist protein RsbS